MGTKNYSTTYNSPSINLGLLSSIRMADLFEAFDSVGIADPTVEQIDSLRQHICDAAYKAGENALAQWIQDRKAK